MAVNCQTYRRLVIALSLTACVACLQMTATGSPQEERPPRPKQAALRQKNAAKDEAKVAVAPEDEVVEGGAVLERGDVEVHLAVLDPQMLLLKRYLRVNCALARRACSLGEPEEQRLKQFNDAWLNQLILDSKNTAIKEVAAGIARFLGGRRQLELRAVNGQPQELEISKVKKEIDTAIEKALEPEHKLAFQRERESRDQFRKRALAAALVAALDERVFLTQPQREELEREISQWMTKELYWSFYFQNSNYIPDFPKRMLSKVLSSEQLAAVQGASAWNYELEQVELQLVNQEPPMIER